MFLGGNHGGAPSSLRITHSASAATSDVCPNLDGVACINDATSASTSQNRNLVLTRVTMSSRPVKVSAAAERVVGVGVRVTVPPILLPSACRRQPRQKHRDTPPPSLAEATSSGIVQSWSRHRRHTNIARSSSSCGYHPFGWPASTQRILLHLHRTRDRLQIKISFFNILFRFLCKEKEI